MERLERPGMYSGLKSIWTQSSLSSIGNIGRDRILGVVVKKSVRIAFIGLVLFVGPVLILGYVLRRFIAIINYGETRAMSDDEAKRVLDGVIGHLPLQSTYRVVQATRQGGRDGGYWMLFQIAPNEVGLLKEEFVRQLRPRDAWRIDDRDDFSTNMFGTPEPFADWWKPEDLPDADVLRLCYGENCEEAFWFVFSKQTGLVYLLQYES